jgi:photosystem II stability/assembly factor-like uncharacterized protein
MKTFQILSLLFFSVLSITACSEKKDDVVITPATPTTSVTLPVTNIPEPEKSTFFTDPIMKKANIISLSFANDQTIFAFGNDATQGYLFKSKDTGKTWSEVPFSMTNPTMNVVEFYDEKVGIIGGRTILGTKDSGLTWTPIPQLSSPITRISYPKNQQGFMMKQIFDNVHSRKYTEIYPINTNDLKTGTDYITIDGYTNDIHFIRNKIGISVGDLGNTYIITVKSDGTFEYSDRLRPVNEDLLSVFLINEKLAFVGGKKGTFLKTNDAGQTWTSVKTSISDNIKKIVFQNENLGYGIVEMEGKTTLYKIEDSGQKWIKIITPETAIFNDLKINALGKAVVVGKDGAVYLFP